MKEKYYDKLLHIKTSENQNFPSGLHYYRYEPTPYIALEQLFESYAVTSSNRLVDFGCGKGRLPFFVHYLFQVAVVGVEMNDSFYQIAQENLQNYRSRNRVNQGQIQFHHCLAEDYRVNAADDRFYFFNPFSVQIFMTVVSNILKSFEKTPRRLDVLLYYPHDDYIYFLENETPFELHADLPVSHLSVHDPYERFSIYRLNV
jgi:SAM-dependent methyltransferase